MAEKKNVFIENIRGIVLASYNGQDTPQYDWNVAIDAWKARHGDIVRAVPTPELGAMRAEFLDYVKDKKFNKYGDEAV